MQMYMHVHTLHRHQGDERDVILLSMVASPSSAPPQLGRMYEQRYNVALSRARDRMVLFRSLDAQHVSNPDDLKGWTLAFFAAAAAPRRAVSRPAAAAAAGTSVAASSAPLPAEAQLLAWLVARGYQVGVGRAQVVATRIQAAAMLQPCCSHMHPCRNPATQVSTECAVAGSCAVVEDGTGDHRLCVCLDGGSGGTLGGWRESLKEMRALQRTGWAFHRIWRASWLVDRHRCERELAAALTAAGVQPAATPAAGMASSTGGGGGGGGGGSGDGGTAVGAAPRGKQKKIAAGAKRSRAGEGGEPRAAPAASGADAASVQGEPSTGAKRKASPAKDKGKAAAETQGEGAESAAPSREPKKPKEAAPAPVPKKVAAEPKPKKKKKKRARYDDDDDFVVDDDYDED